MNIQYEPRPIAQRPDDKLGADEQATIDVFSKFSRSVVHVTNYASRRDRFTMDVTEIQAKVRGFMPEIMSELGELVSHASCADEAIFRGTSTILLDTFRSFLV